MAITTTKLTRAAGLAVVAGLLFISVPTVRDAQLDPAGAE
ncbi:hypothetical protein EV644_101185 [Kribbella orskensis]|uniref:Uncharacterized protein n=1 Tax=Kribbella orskensis TaxID=2512216 RepID=A0ABY2BTI7_9ACTN|nr:hypothetical protein EV642_101804 [Kribbella sp. VKM Ac-2500]TCO31545.1 hypothetical protein EV644_101185 [Kribbella orskensis]